jgi:hypothetical protein
MHLSYPPYLLHGMAFFLIWSPEYLVSTDHKATYYSNPHSPVTSSLWGPNFLLSTLFLNTFSLCPYLNVRDQVSYPHNLYILIFIFLGSKLEDKRFCTEWQQAFPYFKLLWTRHLQNTTQKPNCSLKFCLKILVYHRFSIQLLLFKYCVATLRVGHAHDSGS